MLGALVSVAAAATVKPDLSKAGLGKLRGTITADGSSTVGPYTTAVNEGELLTEVRLKLRAGAGSAHEKVERRAGDWAIAAASAAVWIDGGTIVEAGAALSAVGLTTIHLSRAEELLRGKGPSEDLFEQAGQIASEDCSPTADGRGPVDYKRHLAGVLTTRALRRATARALHQEV